MANGRDTVRASSFAFGGALGFTSSGGQPSDVVAVSSHTLYCDAAWQRKGIFFRIWGHREFSNHGVYEAMLRLSFECCPREGRVPHVGTPWIFEQTGHPRDFAELESLARGRVAQQWCSSIVDAEDLVE